MSKPEFNRGLGATPSPFKIGAPASSKDAKGKGGKANDPNAPSANPSFRAQSAGMQKQTGKGRGGKRKTR